MPTIAQATGFEIPDVNAYGSPSGGSTTISTTQSRGGTRSLRIAATNALCRVVATSGNLPFGFTTGTRQAARFAVFIETMPSAEISIIALGITTPGECFLTIDSGGVMRARWIAGGVAGVGDANATLVTGQWYVIEMEWDTHTASAWVCRWRVNNNVQTDATYTGSATTPSMTQVTWGNTFATAGVGSYAFYLDDFAMSSTAGDYPIGNGYGKGYAIDGTGSHVITTGAFQDDGGNAITAGDTTSHTKLEESTPDTTSFVVQTTAKNTDFLEYTFADTGSPADTPQFVRAVDWKAVASAAVASGGGLLRDGTTSTSIPVSASASFHYREIRQSTRAGAQGAWTTGAIDALKYRIGINASNPATTAVKSSFAFLEVDYAESYNISDSGSVTATAVFTAPDQIADSSPGPGSTVTSGTLGNNATHEPFTANIVYVEKYTIVASAIVSQYQWQGKGDNSGSSEHWKMVIYLDSGAGTTPGALLYASPEQTVNGITSAVTTQSISPTALTIPAGTIWVGIHLSENHLAPTYTNGGSALDSPDTYSDGPNDPWSGGGNTNDNLRDRLLTYIPNQDPTALAILTGSGQLTEQTGSVTAVAVPDGLASFVTFADTVTATVVLTGEGDMITESGTVTAVVDITGQDGNDDSGTVTATVVVSGDDSQNQEGTITAVVDVSGIEQGQDAGTVTAVVVLTGEGDMLVESGTVTVVAALTGDADMLVESGTVTATAVISLVRNGRVDQGLVISLAGPFGVLLVSPVSEAGTIIFVAVISLAAQRLADTGSLTSVAVLAGGDYLRDTGTVTALVSLSLTEGWSFAQTVTATVVLSMVLEALAETNGVVVATALDAVEVFSQDGAALASSAVTTAVEGIGEFQTVSATADFAVTEWIADTGDELAVADIRGFGFESSPTGSRKGYAYPSMTLRYNSRGIDARTGRVTLSATPTAGVVPNLSEPVVTTDQQANEAAANQF